MRCILCGGDHEPNPALCDQNEAGIDREVKRMGAVRWTRMCGLAMQKSMPKEMKEYLAKLRAARKTGSA